MCHQVSFQKVSAGSKLCSPILPLPPKRDPQGRGDQLEVKLEALHPHVERAELELVPAGKIPERVYLG